MGRCRWELYEKNDKTVRLNERSIKFFLRTDSERVVRNGVQTTLKHRALPTVYLAIFKMGFLCV